MFLNKSVFYSVQWKKLRKLSFFCCVAIIIISASAFAVHKLTSPKLRKNPPPDVKIILPQLQHGDIILRSGVGIWSQYIREYNKNDQRFSHVGIIFIEKGKIKEYSK